MDALVDLQAAATATGQPVRRLRRWCATGKLTCERTRQGWILPASQLLRIAGLATERERSIADGHPAAAIVPATTATRDLGGEIARRLGLATSKVTVRTLALDGREYLMAVWKVGGRQQADLGPLVAFVERLGGDVLDGEVGAGQSGPVLPG